MKNLKNNMHEILFMCDLTPIIVYVDNLYHSTHTAITSIPIDENNKCKPFKILLKDDNDIERVLISEKKIIIKGGTKHKITNPIILDLLKEYENECKDIANNVLKL